MNDALRIDVVTIAELDGWKHEEGTDRLHKEGKVKDVLHYYYHLQLRDNLAAVIEKSESTFFDAETTDEIIHRLAEEVG